MQSGFGFDGERLSLLVRIGCGESAYLGDEQIADKLMLVEPDPDRAQSARAWLQQAGAGSLVEAAVADEDGEATFKRTSFADVNSLRVVTGAMALFPGVRALETCTVKTVKPRNLFKAGLEDVGGGPCGLIVDAPSEVLLVLDDLHQAGLLGKFAHVIVRVAEEPLHEGGADRRALEAWLAGAEYTVSWEANPSDPDVRYARLHPDWQARIARREKQVASLEVALEEARHSYAIVSEEAQGSLKAYEAVLSERDELSERCDALQRSLSQVSADLEASRGALDAVRQEREALEASWLKDAEVRQASLEQLREERDSLETARGTAEADLASARDELAQLREERDSLEKARGTAEADLASAREELALLREERDALEKARGNAETDLTSTREELARLREERDGLKEARARALKDSEANLQAFEAMRAERDRLKSSLSAATERADEQAQSLQRLGAELEELRDDNRLSLRIQRIAQADLADLQDRYAALSGEKRELEVFLDELAENVAQAMAVSGAENEEQLEGPARASSKSAGSKPARRSRKSRAQPS
jgi:predicted  nucleic acid-binding Zn-ribbon protein